MGNQTICYVSDRVKDVTLGKAAVNMKDVIRVFLISENKAAAANPFSQKTVILTDALRIIVAMQAQIQAFIDAA